MCVCEGVLGWVVIRLSLSLSLSLSQHACVLTLPPPPPTLSLPPLGLSVGLSACLSVCLSVCQSVSVSHPHLPPSLSLSPSSSPSFCTPSPCVLCPLLGLFVFCFVFLNFFCGYLVLFSLLFFFHWILNTSRARFKCM